MLNFDFYNPTRIVFGRDRLAELSTLVPAGARVLLVYGGGSARKYGTLDKVTKALGSRVIYEFGGIEPNPRYETCMRAVEAARAENLDFILAVGGGSVIDAAKFIGLAAKYRGEASNLFFDHAAVSGLNSSIPLGTVLTLPATGSEMNNNAVISYNHGKWPVYQDLNFPVFSILDPALTFTLPRRQIVNGIIDSFAHVLEQYLTYPVGAAVQDRLAEGILQVLLEFGPRSLAEPENYEVRANIVWAATLSLNRLIGAGVPQDWSSHRIGHELTAMFGIDHGLSLAVTFPSVMEIRRSQKRAKLLQYARRVFKLEEKDEEAAIDAAISKTRQFFESLGAKTRLADYGITAVQLPDLAENLRAHGWIALSEHKDLTPEISLAILKNAL
ncbi:MAG: iron-containing alcohol dehydrogenase [Deltaproteobacteria bacterium]|jgi:NADP-dependent alcohol dehydrogenase|nr:iron-containing alcohol dehydrogenase [Deltaproteobacteria bacterium]